jgi:hypothetical protein
LALSALSGADFASDTLIPLLIAGDLARIAGLDCAGAVALAEQTEQAFNDSVSASDAGIGAAGAPAEDAGSSDAGGSDAGSAATSALRLRELPALVAGTLNGMRSTLLVATGCMGGFGFDNGSVSMLCGASYTPTTPTLFPVFVTLSRLTEAGRVGMQVVHASRATSYVSVSIMGAPPASIGFELVSRLYAGQLGPKPPSFEHPASDYAPQSEIEVGGSISPINQTISQALGGLGKQLVDGSSYALILIGPRLDFGTPPPLWNSAQAVIVPTLSP